MYKINYKYDTSVFHTVQSHIYIGCKHYYMHQYIEYIKCCTGDFNNIKKLHLAKPLFLTHIQMDK